MMRTRVLAALIAGLSVLSVLAGSPARADTWRKINAPLLWPSVRLYGPVSDGQNLWVFGGQGYFCGIPIGYGCLIENPGVPVVRRYTGNQWVEFPLNGFPSSSDKGPKAIDGLGASGGEVWIHDTAASSYLARFNGSAFEKVEQPEGRGVRLLDVGPAGVWLSDSADGLWRRTGTTWTRTPLPAGTQSVRDLGARSATDAWAVGATVNGSYLAHWDGTAWSAVTPPVTAQSLQTVTPGAGDDLWLTSYAEVAHGDGSSWTVKRAPATDPVPLRGLALDPSGVPWVKLQDQPYRFVGGVFVPAGPLPDRLLLQSLTFQGPSAWGLAARPNADPVLVTTG